MDNTECLTLINLAKDGDSEAFNKLSGQYQDLFYKACHKYRQALEKTGFSLEEVLEEKDNVLFKCINTYNAEKGSKFSTWLANQSRYFCLNKMGRKNLGTLDNEFDMESMPLVTENEYVESDCKEIIDTLIDSLEDKRAKEVFRIRYNNLRKNLSWDKVAEQLDISRVTARKIHANAVNLLREKLSERNMLTVS